MFTHVCAHQVLSNVTSWKGVPWLQLLRAAEAPRNKLHEAALKTKRRVTVTKLFALIDSARTSLLQHTVMCMKNEYQMSNKECNKKNTVINVRYLNRLYETLWFPLCRNESGKHEAIRVPNKVALIGFQLKQGFDVSKRLLKWRSCTDAGFLGTCIAQQTDSSSSAICCTNRQTSINL